MAVKPKIADKASGPLWTVLDTLQNGDKPRVHDIAGKKYPLFSDPDRACEVPEEHARVFLKDQAFRVFNEVGDEIATLSAEATEAGVGRDVPKLQPGQVVADADELTDDALKTRVAMRPGGDKLIRAKPSRAAMIEFMRTGDEKILARLNAKPKPKADADGQEDASEEDLKRMFGEAA